MLSRAFAIASALAVITSVKPAQADPQLLPAASEITFVSRQMGVPVEGRFKRFDVQMAFDPKKPETGKVTFSIDTGSASIGTPELDGELAKPNWFNVAKFPKAQFESTGIKATGPGKYDVAGTLSIKGNAQPVVVPVTLAQTGGNTIATGAFAIKRLLFKIGDNEWADTSMVANDVQVRFKLALAGVAPL